MALPDRGKKVEINTDALSVETLKKLGENFKFTPEVLRKLIDSKKDFGKVVRLGVLMAGFSTLVNAGAALAGERPDFAKFLQGKGADTVLLEMAKDDSDAKKFITAVQEAKDSISKYGEKLEKLSSKEKNEFAAILKSIPTDTQIERALDIKKKGDRTTDAEIAEMTDIIGGVYDAVEDLQKFAKQYLEEEAPDPSIQVSYEDLT